MPKPQNDWNDLVINLLIAELLNYSRNILVLTLIKDFLAWMRISKMPLLASSIQLRITWASSFFLNGLGGTGKTFVYNTVCAKLRSDGAIVLCVSPSGISALLLQGGWTVHSMFKIPVQNLYEESFCSIPKNSQHADLLQVTKVIIWDEIGAQHRYVVEALDCTLQDICDDSWLLGGITTILGGNFLQTLPVVSQGSRVDIVDATIQCSHLWEHVEVLSLHQNMRLE